MNVEYLTQKISAKNSNLKEFLNFINNDPDVVDPRWQAYMIATCWKETGGKFAPVTELGSLVYLSKYEPDKPKGKELGNTQPGDGYRFRGRGYCQITGRSNYKKFSKELGLDLVNNPDAALIPNIAYKIMSLGMRNGLFTGVRLCKFFNGYNTDFINARRIINGTDHAVEIAAYAEVILKLLKESA